MCDPATVIAVVGLVAGAVQGQQQLSQQKDAASQATDNARKQESLAEQNINRANQQTPNTNAILSQQQQASKAGGGSTALSGPTGVNPQALTLGKPTLLGQG